LIAFFDLSGAPAEKFAYRRRNFMGHVAAHKQADPFPEEFISLIFFDEDHSVFYPAIDELEPVFMEGCDNLYIINERHPVMRNPDPQFI
jgi:hypothetical protein